MKTFSKFVCSLAVAALFSATQASANILAWDVTGTGSPLNATLAATTIDSGIANTPTLSRVGVLGVAAGAAYNNNNWNNAATFNEGNFYVTFSLVVGASPITLDSLDYAINGSNTAPASGRWGFSINGGSFTTFDFTITNPQPAANSSINLGSAVAGAGDTVEFRWWQFGTVNVTGGTAATTGTARIANSATVGNDLQLNYSIIPEPSTVMLIGVGLVGLLAFVRRRHA